MSAQPNCITVLGASGFIGSHLVKKLRDSGWDVFAPAREAELSGKNLGPVIYCIGVTADFRSRPLDTVTAHVCRLVELMRDCDFASLLYLSSTRLYKCKSKIAQEDDPIQVAPMDPDDLYNVSKLMGESISLSAGRKVCIARVSNVYGGDFASQNFLSAVIKKALSEKKVTLFTSADSEKDYVNIKDVVDGLIRIVTGSRRQIYNLASGANVSHKALLERISQHTGCEVEFMPDAPQVKGPPISIDSMRSDFGFDPSRLLDNLDELIELYKENRGSWK
jgi:nucleoside-diphosphate-sugar epimerase